MRFGFDLDGVLCDIDVVQLQLIIKGAYTPNQKEYLEKLYYENKKPTLNPYQFLADNDEYIVITARAKYLFNITNKWMCKYLPSVEWFLIDKRWNQPKETATEKMKVLREEKVDIYFDDNPKVVEAMRVLNEIGAQANEKDIKIIQFNGKF